MCGRGRRTGRIAFVLVIGCTTIGRGGIIAREQLLSSGIMLKSSDGPKISRASFVSSVNLGRERHQRLLSRASTGVGGNEGVAGESMSLPSSTSSSMSRSRSSGGREGKESSPHASKRPKSEGRNAWVRLNDRMFFGLRVESASRIDVSVL